MKKSSNQRNQYVATKIHKMLKDFVDRTTVALINSRIFSNRKNPKTLSRGSKN